MDTTKAQLQLIDEAIHALHEVDNDSPLLFLNQKIVTLNSMQDKHVQEHIDELLGEVNSMRIKSGDNHYHALAKTEAPHYDELIRKFEKNRAKTGKNKNIAHRFYLGIGLIEYKKLKAPLLLLPIRIYQDSIKRNSDPNMQINPAVLRALIEDFEVNGYADSAIVTINKLRATSFTMQTRETAQRKNNEAPIQLTNISNYQKLLKLLTILRNELNTVSTQISKTNSEVIRTNIDHLVLAEFPVENENIIYDLEQIKIDVKKSSSDSSLVHLAMPNAAHKHTLNASKNLEIRSFLQSSADDSQFKVIQAAAAGKSLTVTGPPGTGKSTTISNMLTVLAAQGKSILFISEKKTAFESIMKNFHTVDVTDKYPLALANGFIVNLSSTQITCEKVKKALSSTKKSTDTTESFTASAQQMAHYDKNINDRLYMLQELNKKLNEWAQCESTPGELTTLHFLFQQIINRTPKQSKREALAKFFQRTFWTLPSLSNYFKELRYRLYIWNHLTFGVPKTNVDLVRNFEEFQHNDEKIHSISWKFRPIAHMIQEVCSQYPNKHVKFDNLLKYYEITCNLINYLRKNRYNEQINQIESDINHSLYNRIKTAIQSRNRIDYTGVLTRINGDVKLYTEQVKSLRNEVITQSLSDYQNNHQNYSTHDPDKLDELVMQHPVWFMQASQLPFYFSLQQKFDVVIFDEASQIHKFFALGALYRAKEYIIIGDENQLAPADTFNDSSESILSYAKSKLSHKAENLEDFSLQVFYRGSEELIYPSSKAIYENGIAAIPHTRPAEKIEHIIIENTLNKMDGIQKMAETVKNIIIENNINTKVFVIVHNKEDRTEYDKVLKEFDHVELFTINEIQGAEADNVIYCFGYARQTQSGTVNLMEALGHITQERHGQARLNVAITRAKKKLFVVSSFTYSELDIADKDGAGYPLLKELLKYLDNLQRNTTVPVPNNQDVFGYSKWERMFAQLFMDQYQREPHTDYRCITMYGRSKFSIPIAFLDLKEQKTTFKYGIQSDFGRLYRHYDFQNREPRLSIDEFNNFDKKLAENKWQPNDNFAKTFSIRELLTDTASTVHTITRNLSKRTDEQ